MTFQDTFIATVLLLVVFIALSGCATRTGNEWCGNEPPIYGTDC